MAESNTSNSEQNMFHRSELLFGHDIMQQIHNTRVIIFGVGGVGSWCAESLVRSGIGHITIVDNDLVSITNCNRQLMATSSTVGMVKVEAMRIRLLDINPLLDIQSIQQTYTEDTASEFHIEDYDYVIDAIDSLKDKVALILHTTSLAKAAQREGRKGPTLFSSMGAALRINPTKVQVAEFWKVHNDTLAAAVRRRMKSKKTFPEKKFLCVFSEENPMPNKQVSDETCSYKAQINGSLSHITGIFGFTLAGLVMQDINSRFAN